MSSSLPAELVILRQIDKVALKSGTKLSDVNEMPGADIQNDGDFAAALAAARTGAEWAWRELYGDAAPRVLRFLRARGTADPQDVLGDVFLSAVRTLPRFEGGRGDFHAWLLTMARNRVIDLARQTARRPSSSGTDELQEMPAADSDPVELAQRQMTSLRVREVIDGLSPDQRDVMVLRILSELNLEETARALGKTVGAVKALQARATAQIRRRMAEEAVSP